MKKRNTLKTHRKQLCIRIAAALGVSILSSNAAWADWATCADQGGGKVLCNGSGSVANGDMYKIAGFTDVEIDLSGAGDPAGGPAGFGIYLNGGNVTVDANNLSISTNGSTADGIRTNGGLLTINGKLTILIKGASGDGINASNSNGSAATVDVTSSNAYIEANNGIGLRANLTSNGSGSNVIKMGANATIITKGSGENGLYGSGYAVYAGGRNSDPERGMPKNGTARVEIADGSTIISSGRAAHAVYANKTGVIQLGNTNITTTNSSAHGIAAEDGYIQNCYDGRLQCILKPNNYPKQYFAGGQVYLTGDTTISVDATKGSYAIYASGTDSSIISGKIDGTTASGVFNVTGDLVAKDGGKIDLVAVNNSYFKGKSDTTTGTGTINLNMSGANSRWDVTGISTVTDLVLNGGAQVVFGDWTAAPENDNRIIFTMDTLSGTGGQFYIGTNLGRDSRAATIDVNDADMIRITGASSGTHTIFVYDDQTGAHVPGEMGVRIVEADQKGATFKLGGTGVVDVGHLQYALYAEETLEGGVQGAGHWALAPMKTLNNFAQNSVGLLNTNYLMSYVETQTLLQRMGELRTPGNQGDVWGRVYTGKLSSFGDDRIGGHDFKYHGLQFGVDRQLDIEAAEGQIYVGGMFGYTKGDTDYNVGSGKTEAYHVGLYGTYMMDNGVYVDGILKYQHLKNSVNSFTGGGYYIDGSDSSSGVSVGIEVGKRFYVQQPDQGWYLEPQGQLTYTHQGSSTIEGSNGLRTDLSSYKSVIGRMSIVAGYEIVDGANPVNVYVKTGYVREFDGKASYTFNQAVRESYDFGGGWWDNGVGVNMRINNRHNLYAEASYAKGSRFDKQQINFGYRFEF